MNESLEMLNENTALDSVDEPMADADEESVSAAPDGEAPEENPMETASDPSVSELDALRAEVAGLRERLAAKEREREEALRELEDFGRLFPDVAIRDVPDSVWQQRERGIPLNAAYALYERESRMAQAKANEINQPRTGINIVTNPTRDENRNANQYSLLDARPVKLKIFLK